MPGIERYSYIGLSVSVFQKSELIDFVESAVLENSTVVLYGYSLWSIVALKDIPEVSFYGEQSDVLVADGRPFYILSRLHGLPLKYEISIPNLVLLCLELAGKNGWSVFLFGAEEYVNQKAQDNLRQQYSNLKAIGGYDGFFDNDQLDDIKNQIRDFEPDILLIGLPSPLKERLAIEWKSDINARIIIPCGGMIDVLGGKTKLTPRIVKKLGLASFYRFIQEPKRLLRKTLRLYYDVFVKFLPLYFWKVVIMRNKNFNISEYYIANGK